MLVGRLLLSICRFAFAVVFVVCGFWWLVIVAVACCWRSWVVFVDLWLGGLGWCFDLLVVFTLVVIAWLVYSLTLGAGLVEVGDCGLVLWGFGDY